MNQMRIGVAALLLMLAAPAGAQNAVEHQLKAAPGKETRVGVYADIRPDCTSGPLPAIRLVVPPAHGAVNVKRGRLKLTNYKQCLATDVPVFVAFYRAQETFSGTDEFTLEVSYPSGHKQTQRFRVNVSNKPSGAQGI